MCLVYLQSDLLRHEASLELSVSEGELGHFATLGVQWQVMVLAEARWRRGTDGRGRIFSGRLSLHQALAMATSLAKGWLSLTFQATRYVMYFMPSRSTAMLAAWVWSAPKTPIGFSNWTLSFRNVDGHVQDLLGSAFHLGATWSTVAISSSRVMRSLPLMSLSQPLGLGDLQSLDDDLGLLVPRESLDSIHVHVGALGIHQEKVNAFLLRGMLGLSWPPG